MTIEERVQKDPTGFRKVLDTTTPAIQEALQELSAKLDVIIGGAIKSYCEAENVEADMQEIASYKTLNKLITGKLDEVIGEHIKDKRKDIL